MASMANVLGLIFANMHDSTISDLTKKRTMGSVPFGGRYRFIDFPLSNMVNSGITDVGVITKANYQSLLDHLGSGSEWDLSRKTGGLHLLPPYGQIGNGLYRGRLEALAGVADYIKKMSADYVVMADSDVIVNMDLKPVVDFHERNNADITVVYGRGTYTMDQVRTKTVLNVNEDNVVYDVLIRPELSGELSTSMNIYVIGKAFLLRLINESASRNLYSFETDVLQHRLNEFKICGYKFDGFFLQIDSIQTYFKSNMELMDAGKRAILFNQDSPIYTKVRDEAPAKYGIGSKVSSSLIADGCVIEGTVENSVLFRGVKVGKGAVIKNCIVLQDTVIGDKVEMNYVITDKDVTVGNYRTLSGTSIYPVFVAKGATV